MRGPEDKTMRPLLLVLGRITDAALKTNKTKYFCSDSLTAAERLHEDCKL